jgi:maleate isomerase
VDTNDTGLAVDRQNMPYELDGGVGSRAKIGLIVLASDQTIEREFFKMLDIPGMPLDVVAYGCTSATMVIGKDKVHARIREVHPSVACTTPMEGTFAAFRALGARRICFLPPYVDEINRGMRRYIMEQGFQVPVMGSWNIADDGKVARLSVATVRKAALELAAGDDVDAVFVSCTNVRLAEDIEALETELGKPVVSSNHATAWHALRLTGYADPVQGFGELFRRPLAPGE